MTAETKTKISVSLVTALVVAALWSLMLARPPVQNMVGMQSTYEACAARGGACPNVQIIWANLR